MKAFSDFGPRGGEQRPDGPRRPPLLADDFAEILLRHPELQDRRLLPSHFRDRYFFGIVHQRLGNELQQFLHSGSLLHPRVAEKIEPQGGMFLMRLFTVSVAEAPFPIQKSIRSRFRLTLAYFDFGS